MPEVCKSLDLFMIFTAALRSSQLIPSQEWSNSDSQLFPNSQNLPNVWEPCKKYFKHQHWRLVLPGESTTWCQHHHFCRLKDPQGFRVAVMPPVVTQVCRPLTIESITKSECYNAATKELEPTTWSQHTWMRTNRCGTGCSQFKSNKYCYFCPPDG